MARRRELGLAAVMTTVGLASLAAHPAAPAARATPEACASLVHTALANGRVERAELVPAGRFRPAEGAPVATTRPFCRASGFADPSGASHIGFEVWLPAAGWSGRIHMVGNGAYSSEIRYALLARLVGRGDAAVATDTGHKGQGLSFGTENPEAIADWGHRAVHQSIEAGKRLVRAYYGRPPDWSYFTGCSTGGHQALMSAQRYPDDFDGIIAGAPGANRTNLNFAFLWQFQQNHERGDNRHPILDRAALITVNRAVLARCDGLDGVRDGVVTDPRQCRFDPSVTLCKPGVKTGCLTPRQVQAVAAMYAGARRAGTGEQIYPGWPVGSESSKGRPTMMAAEQAWDIYWANPLKPEEPQRIDYIRNWALHDPAWDWWSFDWDKDVDRVRAAMGPRIDAVDPDLSAFERRGGKLIMFSGWQDPVVSPYDTVAYYTAVAQKQGGFAKAQSFARLFLVPGMPHCAGGAGASNFASTTRDSPPLKADAAHDMSLALEAWVEHGRAPDRIIAAKYAGDGPASGVVFTRPLCAYPQLAYYRGKGDPKRAANYVCTAPRKTPDP
jgi:feruloyl esterase